MLKLQLITKIRKLRTKSIITLAPTAHIVNKQTVLSKFHIRIRIWNMSLNFPEIREGPNTYSPIIGQVESEYR